MQLGKVKVPCGCEARKEIMFTQGGLDARSVALTVTGLAILTVSLYLLGRTVSP